MARRFTREQVGRRSRREDAAIIIDNAVYDVTTFLEDHPGGAEVLLDNAGGDASKCFRDVGHSEDAKLWRERFRIGEVVEAERRPEQCAAPAPAAELGCEPAGLVRALAPPLALAALATLVYLYLV